MATMFLIQYLSNLHYYCGHTQGDPPILHTQAPPAAGMSVLEWAWLATFALIVAVYVVHFARGVLPDFFQTLLSYGNKRKNGSVFADVPKRY